MVLTEEQTSRLTEIIRIAVKLKWTEKNPTGYPKMQLSEVEKCMSALIDDNELWRMREWEAGRTGQPNINGQQMQTAIKNIEELIKKEGIVGGRKVN